MSKTSKPVQRLCVFTVMFAMFATAFTATAAGAKGDKTMLGAPKVGQCYLASNKQATADLEHLSAPAIPCSQKHNLYVSLVVPVPSKVDMDAEADSLTNLQLRECVAATVKAVGDSNGRKYARSAYRRSVILPTPKQQRSGARWLACLVSVYDGLNKVAVTRGKPVSLAGGVPKELGLCMDKHYKFIACGRPHKYSIKHTSFIISSTSSVQRKAKQMCEEYDAHAWRMTKLLKVSKQEYGVFCLS